MTEPFYIGWQERAPAPIARATRVHALLLLVVAGGVAALLARGHERLPAAAFEFLEARELVGVLTDEPVPALRVERPGRLAHFPASSTYPLTRFGKHGAGEAVAPWVGRRVRLEGMLIYRDGETQVELVAGTIRAADGEADPPAVVSERLGAATLRGEIVDSKCFFGVMNPGSGKPHRACAVRCISGGVPPVLWVRDAAGDARYLLLLSAEGVPVNDQILEMVAEPLEITGEVVRYGDLLALLADPRAYRRLP